MISSERLRGRVCRIGLLLSPSALHESASAACCSRNASPSTRSQAPWRARALTVPCGANAGDVTESFCRFTVGEVRVRWRSAKPCTRCHTDSVAATRPGACRRVFVTSPPYGGGAPAGPADDPGREPLRLRTFSAGKLTIRSSTDGDRPARRRETAVKQGADRPSAHAMFGGPSRNRSFAGRSNPQDAREMVASKTRATEPSEIDPRRRAVRTREGHRRQRRW